MRFVAAVLLVALAVPTHATDPIRTEVNGSATTVQAERLREIRLEILAARARIAKMQKTRAKSRLIRAMACPQQGLLDLLGLSIEVPERMPRGQQMFRGLPACEINLLVFHVQVWRY